MLSVKWVWVVMVPVRGEKKFEPTDGAAAKEVELLREPRPR